jgi:2,3-bisphosphoglycerate-dependent phosphoglycerate mutase
LREATRILAIRHGETAWNAEMRMQGQLNTPLNDVGRWQADRLAAAIGDEPIDAIYASDLDRAMYTALPLARAVGRSVVAEPGLRERAFGDFEGLLYAEIECRWPEQAMRWRMRDPSFGPQGGESLDAFNQRCIQTAERLIAGHGGHTIVWVTHGGVLDCLYRSAARLALDAERTWSLGNAAVNRLLHADQGLMLVGWGDNRHLAASDPDASTP